LATRDNEHDLHQMANLMHASACKLWHEASYNTYQKCV